MKKLRILCITFCFLMISMTAFAANWQWVLSTDTFGVYYDTNSISRNYFVVDAWLKYDYPYPENNISYVITNESYNLRDKTWRVKSITNYDKK